MLFIGGWNLYSYYMYNRSGHIISKKDRQLDQTRDAYVDLMTEFVALNKNVSTIVASLEDVKDPNDRRIQQYKAQAEIIENKIHEITEANSWLAPDEVT